VRTGLPLLLLVATAPPCAGRTVPVTPGDPLREIAGSLGAGDTLFLAPGTYSADDTLPLLRLGPAQDGLTVTSDPANRAVLDGESRNRPVLFLDGSSSSTRIENLVVTGGRATDGEYFSGGGAFLAGSEVTLSNCAFLDNDALIGGGVGVEGGSPILRDCVFEGNHAEATGGGLGLFACGLEASGLRFIANQSSDDGAGLWAFESDIALTACLFHANAAGDDGGGLAIGQGTAVLSFVTVHGNSASDDGGGMLLHTAAPIEIRSCIVTQNTGKGGVATKGTPPEVVCTCCWGNEYLDWWGMENPAGTGGNISEDPLFADGTLMLSQLAAGQEADSPALDAGHLTAEGSPVEGLTTRTDSLPDQGMADMGYHAGRTAPDGGGGTSGGPLGLSVYPSPCSGDARILLVTDRPSRVTVTVYDLSGRPIASPGTFQVDGLLETTWEPPPALPPGPVYLRAVSDGFAATASLVFLR